MKKHLKKLRPLLLLTTLFLLTNCQEEFEEHEHVNSQDSEMKIITKPFNYFEKLPSLIDKTISRERLRKVQDSTDIYNFKIDSTSVMQVTTDSGTYYTMAITRDFDYPVDMFENLVISDTGKTQDAYIASYKPNPIYYSWLENHHILAPFDGEFSLTRIDYKALQKAGITNCVTTNVLYCNAEFDAHPYGPSCKGSPSTFYVAVTTCTTWIIDSPLYTSGSFPLQLVAPWGGGGGGGGNGTGSYGGGNGSGGTPPSPGNSGVGVFGPFKPGLSGPVTGPVNPNKSCEALKKIAETPNINTSLNTLKGYVHSSNNERLFTLDKNGSGATYVTPEASNSGLDGVPRIKASTYGIAHIHQKGVSDPSGLYEMFSLADLRIVYFIAKGFAGSGVTAAPIHFNMLVLGDYTYAVMPNNVGAFKNLDYIFEDKKKYKELSLALKRVYGKKGEYNQVSHDVLAEEFLKFINNANNNSDGVNFDVSLYRIDNSNNHFGNWEKLEFDSNNEKLKITPCK